MLAEAAPTGANYWLILGPLVIAAAIVAWIFLTRRASRRRVPHTTPDTSAHRGPVRGGVIEGDPGQRNAGHHEAPRQP